ncbi:hypothetical protein M758_9G041500 [Ceratodon purpureus]|uniref:Secreted protein n=1 Tax=Ceratodon purpureus TaxID=3225 RepID=A0A8T0GQ46_CERPU|nr:hypothetical protein KC19_9G040800 [Ceratodon purpureus]KAG0605227.1 hypothetical protein M758_9G041500 [Ceratodon purpureus]
MSFGSFWFMFCIVVGVLCERGALAELCAERHQHTVSISAAQIVSSDLPTSPCSRERRD